MLIPNPILFGPTPPGGAVLIVTADRGGLAGYIVLGVHGPTATVERYAGGVWAPLSYPHALVAGEQLRLTRTDLAATLTTLRMLAPVDEGPLPTGDSGPRGGFTVLTDIDGYQTLDGAEMTLDAEGYHTLTNATAIADADGYETVERS